MTATDLLTVTESLLAAPLSADELAQSVGGNFVESRSGDGFSERTATDAPGFMTVMRHERPGVVRVELAPSVEPCLTWDEMRTRFGFAAGVSTHPGAPEPEHERWQFPQQGPGRLSAAFDRADKCAVTIVVEHVAE